MFSQPYCALKSFVVILILFCCVSMMGCASDHGGTEVGNPGNHHQFEAPESMDTFESVSELESYLKEQYATNVVPYSLGDYKSSDDIALDGSGENSPDSVEAPSDSGAEQYSQTNIQEAGVDESDQVKTDGTYMYVAGQQSVTVAKVVPADAMNVVSSIDVKGDVDSLYLYNDILAVLYTPDDGYGQNVPYDYLGPVDSLECYYIPVSSKLGLMLIDVSEPDSPKTIEIMEAEGQLVSSRLTGGKLHIVQKFLSELPPLDLRYNTKTENYDVVVAANRELLSPLTIDELLPTYERFKGEKIETGQLVAPENFYYPDKPVGGSIVTIVTYNMDNLSQPVQGVGVVADAHNVYASTQALYLVTTQYTSKLQKNDTYSYHYQTILQKFDLTGESVKCIGVGSVPGETLNQFSLGEYKHVLRVATTTGEVWGSNPTSKNHLFCLEATDKKLEIIGKIEDLAPGERIYAARFIGTRGYLVTFVKVDPLFTLDLSDPTSPKVVGELKVPGYSDYIHPLGENHLLTIGKDAKEQGGTTWYQGVQLSIFDISDFSYPKLAYKELIGVRGTGSEALHNHKAFTFWVERDLLAIPVDLCEFKTDPTYSSQWGTKTFEGLYVYRVEADNGFTLLGRISTGEPSCQNCGYSWTRGVFIDDGVYAVKENAVRSAEVENIEDSVITLNLID